MSTTVLDTSSKDTSVIFALITAMLIWGSSWISGKIIADMAPAKVTVFYRIALATISMLPILLFVKKAKLQRLFCSNKAIFWSLPAGTLMAMYNQFFFLGLLDGLPGKGGMLVTTTNPIFTIILSTMILRIALSTKQVLGCVIGLVGGLLMIEVWHFDSAQVLASGNAYFLLASLTWAFLTLISKQGTKFCDFLTFSTLMYFWATLLSYVFAFELSPIQNITSYSATYWYHMFYLSIIVVSIATSIFFLATQQLGPSRSSSFIFIVPVTAMGMSIWYFNESLSLTMFLGGAFALCAVYLLNQPVKTEPNTSIK
ncbi:DMT family transporter [Pseudoalteromonas luteoviolacea]|uniref:DMT family transporter n=1 Tax=Pseudoalteromonas luteoviolacea TaxID=43657 RepID=UPI001B3862F9|nr:DMT family transporter [Pseudoalteromonas luteoviolacea]MBQ4835937.1 DMT family transporter [Pseudoalteromonas luteoviolacea]